jgi:hypothetical protein
MKEAEAGWQRGIDKIVERAAPKFLAARAVVL